jgi:phosphoglycolate phosphatase-like HAD superfamily hydrolase
VTSLPIATGTPEMNRRPAVLFDLDGTLMDTRDLMEMSGEVVDVLGPLEWTHILQATQECRKLVAVSLDMAWWPNLEAALTSAERTLRGG